MPRFSKVAAPAALLALLAGLTGCTPGAPARPDPATLVDDYLGAIAAGDTATARSYDEAAVAEALGSHTDPDLLRTDEVLASAEPISDIKVETQQLAADVDSTRVGFDYRLDGETQHGSLAVEWDAESNEWRLAEAFTLKLSITATVSLIEMESVPFTIGSTDVELGPDPDEAPVFYLVYPGVYTISADFDPALLTDGEGLTRTAVAVPPDDLDVDYPVSALPSS